jgi:hypothetical protein
MQSEISRNGVLKGIVFEIEINLQQSRKEKNISRELERASNEFKKGYKKNSLEVHAISKHQLKF